MKKLKVLTAKRKALKAKRKKQTILAIDLYKKNIEKQKIAIRYNLGGYVAQVFAKWIVEGSREEILDMIEDGEFFIQTYETPEDDNSDTLDPADGDSKINFTPVKGGRLDGCYEVVLTGEAKNEILSPSAPEEAHCYDENGKEIGEACDFGPVKRRVTTKKKAVKK